MTPRIEVAIYFTAKDGSQAKIIGDLAAISEAIERLFDAAGVEFNESGGNVGRRFLQMKLTKALIYAAALDAAERSKRKRGVAVTDNEASDAYFETFDQLFDAIGGAEGWMDLPAK